MHIIQSPRAVLINVNTSRGDRSKSITYTFKYYIQLKIGLSTGLLGAPQLYPKILDMYQCLLFDLNAPLFNAAEDLPAEKVLDCVIWTFGTERSPFLPS